MNTLFYLINRLNDDAIKPLLISNSADTRSHIELIPRARGLLLRLAAHLSAFLKLERMNAQRLPANDVKDIVTDAFETVYLHSEILRR